MHDEGEWGRYATTQAAASKQNSHSIPTLGLKGGRAELFVLLDSHNTERLFALIKLPVHLIINTFTH